MMMMMKLLASGRASALRVNHTSTAHFKTRITPCRIAVRADHEKCEQITKNGREICGVCTSFGDQQKRVQAINPASVRFTENRTLKTADSQRRCGLHFPYGMCRCSTTGLLEQMP
jgi:hypothetical protein